MVSDNPPEILILYLERLEDSDNAFFQWVNTFITGEGKKCRLYFIGNAGEINMAYEFIHRDYVKYAFERPVEMPEFLKILEKDGGDYSFSDGVKEYELDETKKTILVVDDEQVQLHAMDRWLNKNYNVLTEKSGTNAIALLSHYKVDMILLDYEMPVLSGLDVFQLLKSDPSTANIPVVFLTANDDSEIVKQVIAARPVGYLLKNTPPGILVQKIADIFQRLADAKKPKRPF
jgi:CheY-like chemotaxis protein